MILLWQVGISADGLPLSECTTNKLVTIFIGRLLGKAQIRLGSHRKRNLVIVRGNNEELAVAPVGENAPTPLGFRGSGLLGRYWPGSPFLTVLFQKCSRFPTAVGSYEATYEDR
jgi:hypothetical protein